MLPSPLKSLSRPFRGKKEDDLHVAVETGRTKKIKSLLRNGVHIESVNHHGQTPLYSACFGGDFEIVQLLLKLGANPNRRCGASGATPVHAAAYRGSRKVLRLLIEAGGDLTLKDNQDLTSKDYANKQPSIIRRQKILQFLDLLLAMTLHKSYNRPLPSGLAGTMVRSTSNLTSPSDRTLDYQNRPLTTARRVDSGSMTSIWGACISEATSPAHETSPSSPPPPPDLQLAQNTLRKNVSCHLLEQMCVTTSLPLVTPADLHRSTSPGQAFTCGGPTVYSPFVWLGTPVTVRRPTPALSLPIQGSSKGIDNSTPDTDAVKSLLQELAVLRRLRHPAFLEVMSVCHVMSPPPDHVTLVFQHIPYGSLYHHLHQQHRDLSIIGAVDLLVGIAEGLMFLHANKWLHAGLSSHCIHLVSLNHAKLGGFEHALEVHKLGCSMKADHVTKSTWLAPWQAPETLTDKMASVRSEVYAFTTIIWEIWSGMAPWAGVDEVEVTRRVGDGETLPPLCGVPPSLVAYLTQYGLKWNVHERELEFQEIHTMLKSLRIQADDSERVPAVTSWGPPSIPNTPVIGRNKITKSASTSSTSSCDTSSSITSLTQVEQKKSTLQHARTDKHFSAWSPRNIENRERYLDSQAMANDIQNSKLFRKSPTNFTNTNVPSSRYKEDANRNTGWRRQPSRSCNEGSLDSGFATPCEQQQCPRTPSPVNVTRFQPTIITSTPVQGSAAGNFKYDRQPDLLPNKMCPQDFIKELPPDIINSGSPECSTKARQSNCEIRKEEPKITYVKRTTEPYQKNSAYSKARYKRKDGRTMFSPRKNNKDELFSPMQKFPLSLMNDSSSPTLSDDEKPVSNFGYISDRAKREFLSRDEDSSRSSEGSPLSARPQSGSSTRRLEQAVKRGLSLTNICAPALMNTPIVFTRTTSHVSLCSTGSSSPFQEFGKRPQRTVSQITLTLRKLSSVSDSSSSKETLSDPPKPSAQEYSKTKRSKSVPKSPCHSARSANSKTSLGWEGVTGIKPASHQLTRHSSSCSLASGPSSPCRHSESRPGHSLLTMAPLANHGSLPSSPTYRGKSSISQSADERPASACSSSSSIIGATAEDKLHTTRRHSDGHFRIRTRKLRKPQDMDVVLDDFFDDEFNAALYEQPHMQLSVGSAENLLDTRMSGHSVVSDDSEDGLNKRFNSTLTLTDTEEKEEMPTSTNYKKSNLKVVEESSDSTNDKKPESKQQENNYFSDTDEVFTKTLGLDEFRKEFEPLRSVELLRNLGNNLSTYLPKYSVGSDTESGEQ